MNCSFSNRFSLTFRHGFISIKGILDDNIAGKYFRQEVGVMLNIVSWCVSWNVCINFSCIRCAGALLENLLTCCEDIGLL